jgi:DNA-binding transcriptional ArsR family regulator
MKINALGTTKSVLKYMLLAGAITVAATNPRFGSILAREMIKSYRRRNKFKESEPRLSKKDKQKYRNTFYYLKNNELLDIEYRGGQMYFSLTEEGKKKARKYKIDDLKIEKPKQWDKKWRILIFDIESRHRAKREALRGKIKQLGLYQLQKSVWVSPYEFEKEMKLLRDFFGLELGQMKVITASQIEDDGPIRKFFGLK